MRERAPGRLAEARRFFGRRRGVLLRLAGWSLVEAGQTFLGGYCLAQALDRGFLAGRGGVGAAWLTVAALAILAGGPVARGVFAQLAALVEPFRDGLVRRAVDQALWRATGGAGESGVGQPAGAPVASGHSEGSRGYGGSRGSRGSADSRASARSGGFKGSGGSVRSWSSGSAVSRLAHQTEIARDSFAGLVLTVRSFVFTAVGALGGMLALAPELLLVALPPLVLGLGLFGATLRPMAAAQRTFLDADEEFTERVRHAGAGLRDVAACGVRAEVGAHAAEAARTARRASYVLARWSALRTLALGIAGQLPPLLLLLATPWLLDRGLTAGVLTGALTYLVQSLLPALHTLMTALGAAGTRLLVVLERFDKIPEQAPPPLPEPEPRPRPDRKSGAAPAPVPLPAPASAPAPISASLPAPPATPPAAELRDVTFAHGPGARPVLDGLELVLAAGEHLAVVGPSGIGKSTLALVLAGLLRPDRGEAFLAGLPVEGRTPVELARLRAVIPQQAYVFTATVRENLTHLHPDATAAQVSATVGALGLGPLVARIGGLDALLIPGQLSQGERQLIALGRAHLAPAPLLLLDEATCHLDPEAEERAELALAARPGTLVVVAHRMSSALRADRILVLDGTVARTGTHAQLLESSPLYRDLTGHWHRRSAENALGGDAPAVT
ncbi:ATP-binding cassette domain-containing protein [Streptomyces sp. NPDC058657]|uniref:ATP-binding cassette domain-containing protein n=1 Tax=unclassified Streptomyces TaxID=2593676 RepID=UPI0036619C0D